MANEFPRQQSTVEETIRQQLQEDFNESIDLTEESVFTTLAEVISTVLANNQEQSLQEVYEAAFLETATGIDLDRVVALAGIQRRDAVHATGVQRFTSSQPVNQDYVIPNGTTVQTGGEEPIRFDTTERVILQLFDNFESTDPLGKYTGDTGSFGITSSNTNNGDGALEMNASTFSHIFNPEITVQRGTEMHAYVRVGANETPRLTFAVQDRDNFYQLAIDQGIGNITLDRFESFSTSTIASDTASVPEDTYLHVIINWAITGDMSFEVREMVAGNEQVIASDSGNDETWQFGNVGFAASDATSSRWDDYTTKAVTANVRAVEGGTIGNVGPNTVTNLPSPISGVNTVTNPYSVGDTDYFDTGGQRFVAGDNRETDEELRERTKQSVSQGGDATADAIISSLINNVEGVTSVSLFENKDDTDNTGSGGLPPYSFEAVVYGGDPQIIAEEIYDTKAVTSRDYGGANGTAVSRSVVSDVNGQTFTINFSRPTEVNIDLTLDIIITENYIGDEELRNRIVNYIGGTLSRGDDARGLEVTEDVLLDQLRDIVVGPEDTGVRAFDQSVDGTPLSTSPSSTTVDGIEVVEIGANEVAQTDATDGSITINKRQI